jgi:hypothetical protein
MKRISPVKCLPAMLKHSGVQIEVGKLSKQTSQRTGQTYLFWLGSSLSFSRWLLFLQGRLKLDKQRLTNLSISPSLSCLVDQANRGPSGIWTVWPRLILSVCLRGMDESHLLVYCLVFHHKDEVIHHQVEQICVYVKVKQLGSVVGCNTAFSCNIDFGSSSAFTDSEGFTILPLLCLIWKIQLYM